MREKIMIKDWILYEDKYLIVCDKPAGMAVQSARIGQMDLESALKNELASREAGKIPFLGVIHRLDQPVEGVVLFAKDKKTAAGLNEQMANGKMEKYYLAVTGGTALSPRGRLEDWIKKEKGNYSQIVPQGTKGSKKAVLEYEVQKQMGDKMLVKIHLMTGRHHQIRVQMAHAGMPLIGDRKYGLSGEGLGLCACCLSFVHPVGGKQMNFEIRPHGKVFQSFFE